MYLSSHSVYLSIEQLMLYGPGCEMVTFWVGSFPHTSTRMHPQLERAATKQTRCKLKEKKKKKTCAATSNGG